MQKKELINAAVEVLNSIWIDIDFKSMSKQRQFSFWDEFTSKVRGCANTSVSFDIFIEKMSKKLNILSLLDKTNAIKTVSRFDEKTQSEILKLYREQLMIIMLELRIKREEKRQEYREFEETNEEI